MHFAWHDIPSTSKMASLLYSSSSITATPFQFSPHPKTFKKPSHFSTRAQKKEIPPTDETSQVKFDRRNLLVGLGGLYGAANLLTPNSPPPAFATTPSPIQAPDLSTCSKATDLNTGEMITDMNCCPPTSLTITDYKIPKFTALRLRPAAQLATPEYWEKYELALTIMKALPEEDPRSFFQQAHVHCAYCNLAYEQTGDPGVKLEIHNSWLFFPWHRWYIYFYERILGSLIDDPTFAIPFWNWDDPCGMAMPDRFVKTDSPLYDKNRYDHHLPPRLADLTYSGYPYSTDNSVVISNNLTEMYGEMVSNATKLEDFYGSKYVTGTAPDPGPGTVERGSHTAIHKWTGDRSQEGFDMGNFATAGKDPIFYAHHANVDRLWTIWCRLRCKKQTGFLDPEWLGANFVFYDENAQLVRVYVGDAIENERMGYTYEKVVIPWLNYKPKANKKKSKIASTTTTALKVKDTVFPVKLDKVLKVLVDRPKKSRSKTDKENEEELLVIEGIEVDTAKFVRFEVYVNDEGDKPEEIKGKAEYAGCYSQVPSKNSTKVKSKIRLGLTELLEELDVDDDDQILVSVVPRAGGEDITIGGIKIVYEA